MFWEHIPPIRGDCPLCNMYDKKSGAKTHSSRQKHCPSSFTQNHSSYEVRSCYHFFTSLLTSVHQKAKFLHHSQVPTHPVNAIYI
jgi:hypothetical protein